MSISKAEILRKYKWEDLDSETQSNIDVLLERMNIVRELYGKPMVITSGLRTKEDQIRVYKDKGITDISKIPMKSKHLYGCAVDVADSDGKLNQWCKDNEEKLREIGIWLETRQGGWQHFQIQPYGSYTPKKTIFFNP